MFFCSERFTQAAPQGRQVPLLRIFQSHFSMVLIAAIRYNVTADADQYSSRVASRGLFTETNERFLQKTWTVHPAQTCSEFTIRVQVRPQNQPFLSVCQDDGTAKKEPSAS